MRRLHPKHPDLHSFQLVAAVTPHTVYLFCLFPPSSLPFPSPSPSVGLDDNGQLSDQAIVTEALGRVVSANDPLDALICVHGGNPPGDFDNSSYPGCELLSQNLYSTPSQNPHPTIISACLCFSSSVLVCPYSCRRAIASRVFQ